MAGDLFLFDNFDKNKTAKEKLDKMILFRKFELTIKTSKCTLGFEVGSRTGSAVLLPEPFVSNTANLVILRDRTRHDAGRLAERIAWASFQDGVLLTEPLLVRAADGSPHVRTCVLFLETQM